MKHSCGNEMRDIGEWPTSDFTSLVNRYHCEACNEYVSYPVIGYKLEKQADGSFKQVPA